MIEVVIDIWYKIDEKCLAEIQEKISSEKINRLEKEYFNKFIAKDKWEELLSKLELNDEEISTFLQYAIEKREERICQGDILKNVEYLEKIEEYDDNGFLLSKIIFPYVIVLSQDCDLHQDFNDKREFKFIDSSIKKNFSEMFKDSAEKTKILQKILEQKEFLSQEKLKNLNFSEEEIKFILYHKERNRDKHLLSIILAPLYNAEHVYTGEHLIDLDMKRTKVDKKKISNNYDPRYHFLEFPSHASLVPSVIDFKHYFSVDINYITSIKKNHYICKVAPLYREQISHRFAYYLSRIGLPDNQ